MYAAYHGPKGIRAIAERVHRLAKQLAAGLERGSLKVKHPHFFDTVCFAAPPAKLAGWLNAAKSRQMNFRQLSAGEIAIAIDETTKPSDIQDLLAVFDASDLSVDQLSMAADRTDRLLQPRRGPILTHPVFNQYHSETEMLRYLKLLENRDFSLAHGMIPLGSCTMKLNATAEMIPVTWPQFGKLHPFAPREQAAGYECIFRDLEQWLAEITGLPGVSLQPNAGSQGEYAGLLVVRQYHQSRGQGQRNICLIPASAHGTNPASAVMAGCDVVVVACDQLGSIDLADLEQKARQHSAKLAALMVTYPSTYGVFEENIRRICEIVHEHGGQVYLDGANMNAQVGLCRPGEFGADVCHLNLHKTFCIPHGGGGPGMGPIAVAQHLVEFLPGHPVVQTGGGRAIGPISAAPWGSASILLISWCYIRLMGSAGLTQASKVAILNANYIANCLDSQFPVLFRGTRGRVAHECILDTRPAKKLAGVEVEDIAKRLMDYGFHAPTVSFPVPGTLMIEPTESETKAELDRFCEAMVAIRNEIREIEQGKLSRDDNPLKHAPHSVDVVVASQWLRSYSRERAAFPNAATRRNKFWPAVARIDSAYGDRNLACTCPPIEEYAERS
jgi:glycine dehydrogenase